MNSATPLYEHPFGYLGTILGGGHLRTLKVTLKLLCAKRYCVATETREHLGKPESVKENSYLINRSSVDLKKDYNR